MADVRAWKPAVDGIAEVFHAHFTTHAYPLHTHDTWTLLIVDDGAIRYGLDRHEHGAWRGDVTLLPPHVPHDGRSARSGGFRKRVLYLDSSVLGDDLIGAAADHPSLADLVLREQIHRLHESLLWPEPLESSSRLALVQERIRAHLRPQWRVAKPIGVAEQMRELMDARVAEGVSLRDAALAIGAHPAHLVRAFTRRFGLPPHRYLTGRRIELARRLILAGMPLAQVATAAGFYDQAHLTRHFRRHLGITPGNYFTRT
ncbi:AraC family transcriptional regulator [Allorhizocola rhizosphaerae]|uniref:AraC family transcriptional regulator n=1 Tax=Allorhizocola rhizosphaerae TaxID=1872709 RepID=UPI000E3E6DF1|nr:AraC family transcriptional regulator [Allorhizocola rhizosphaerae]